MGVSQFGFYFSIIFLAGLGLVPAKLYAQEKPIICQISTIKTPPIFVVPTGFDTETDQDTVERGRESRAANYYVGSTKLSDKKKAVGKAFVVPKRSIVIATGEYRDTIEKTGAFSKSKGDEWIEVKVLSLPPENKRLQKSTLQRTKAIAKHPYPKNVEEARVGDLGFLKVADLEKVDKQKDYTFVVKQDSELFKNLNKSLGDNNYESVAPLVLKLKQVAGGFEVNRCCLKESNVCTNYPIFQLLNLKDRSGKEVDIPIATDCFSCQANIFKSIVPIEETFLKPIQSILSHPSLGLPDGSNDIARAASIADLNFVDSRGFVKIPLVGDGGERKGPFNSTHYSPENGDGDAYLKPDVACGFMQFLKAWDKTCQGKDECAIDFGDSSHAYFKERIVTEDMEKSPWPHRGHTSGECIDINTSRMKNRHLLPMLNMLKKLGPSDCRTTESTMIDGGCENDNSHKTHMHICFPSNTIAKGKTVQNKKLKDACETGVKP